MPQRDSFRSGGEHIACVEICNDFYVKFSMLIAESLKKVPDPELEELLLVMLSDTSSVYGSDYETYMDRQ